MKYLPDWRLFFVHVPKCAGVSIRKALDAHASASYAPMAADFDVTEAEMRQAIEIGGGLDHPAMGRVHPAHIPLPLIRAHLPQTWAALTAAHSFCMVRAPRSRFISALMQRLTEFKGAGAIRADDPVVAEEAKRVCDWLAARQSFADVEYTHFTRQIDHAAIDGQQRVTAVFEVERTDLLEAWIAGVTGHDVAIAHEHARREPKGWARGLTGPARLAARHLMPHKLKRALHPLWMKSGVFADAASGYGAVELGAEVEAFIASYYAADAALLAETRAKTA